MWLLIVPLVFGAEPLEATPVKLAPVPAMVLAANSSHAAVPAVKIQTVALRSSRAESKNFVVYSVAGAPPADEIADICEQRCAELRLKWLGLDTAADWSLRCEVILHASRESYLAAVGKGGDGTLGSSLVQFDSSRITSRRIDLLAHDRQNALSALPHEMTHVVLADRFGHRTLPRWADEGIATLADSANKQRLHLVDLQRGLAAGRTQRLTSVLFAADYPPANQRALYYGSSLSLVHFLSTLDQPGRVLEFAEKSMDSGHRIALQEVYGIQSVVELERQWREHLKQSSN